MWPCLNKYLDTFYLAFDMLILFIVSIHNSEFYGCFYPPLRHSQRGFVPRVGQVGAGPPLKEQLHELRLAADVGHPCRLGEAAANQGDTDIDSYCGPEQ